MNHRFTIARVSQRLFALALLALMSFTALSMAPRAGTTISNQGSMSFNDAQGQPQTVFSNFVMIDVLQVFSLTLEQSQTRPGTAGNDIDFFHELTNTGNGTDSFLITAENIVGDNYDFDNIDIFLDDGSGNPTGPAITGPISVGPGDSVRFIVRASIPAGQTPPETADLLVTATSQGDTNQAETNTDTATLAGGALVNINKSFTPDEGDPGTTTTITLDVSNVGSQDANTIVFTDVLDDSLIYVDGTGTWSENTDTITDEPGGDPNGIDYAYNAGTNTVTVTIDTVAPGAANSQTVSFQVQISPDAVAGPIENRVTFNYDDDNDPNTPPVNDESNITEFDVNQLAGPDASDQSPDGNTTSSTDQDGQIDDVVTVNTAGQGATVDFENIITNDGNGEDSFNIATIADDFPPGTVFQILHEDGTPLLDTNDDGIPDTGPLDPDESIPVIIRAILPPDATGNNGGDGFDVTVEATSTFDPTQSDTVLNTLGAITDNMVDLTNDVSINGGADASNGAGQGPEANAVVTNNANAGDTTTFTLFVNNTDAGDDSYVISAPVLPDGWTTVFFLDDGNGIRDDGDTAIPSGQVGTIAGGDNVLVFADVAVPAGETPATYDVNFQVTSPITGATDTIHDAVVVGALTDVTIDPENNTGTTPAGGSVTYPHTVTNNGNTPQDVLIDATNGNPDFGDADVYIDVDGDGQLSPGDILIDPNDPITLQPGEELDIIVVVTAPIDGDAGDMNTTTVTVTYDNGNQTVTATDVTTITAGDAEITKFQALDADCDGTVEGAFTMSNVSAEPNQCVRYRLIGRNTANPTNPGATTLTNVVISDRIPAFTTFENCGGACPATASGGVLSAPGDGQEGTVTDTVPSLAPGASETLEFTVRLNPTQ